MVSEEVSTFLIIFFRFPRLGFCPSECRAFESFVQAGRHVDSGRVGVQRAQRREIVAVGGVANTNHVRLLSIAADITLRTW